QMSEALSLFDFPPPASFVLLGGRFEAVDAEAGVLEPSFEADPRFLNPGGVVQGGFLTAMVDDTMGPLVMAMTKAKKFPSTTDIHTTFYAPAAPGGRLQVRATADRIGGTIAYTSAEIRDKTGTLIARAIQTARLLDFGKGSQG
ncbi:MAG: PaaI family thioesterase, partial [Maricaulaceae bacterium]